MSHKLANSPPSSSNSMNVQHDQIPQNSNHSSASYKQELMDSSVLLDNIEEILITWDDEQNHTHSLQQPSSYWTSLNTDNNGPLIQNTLSSNPHTNTANANTMSSNNNNTNKYHHNKHKYHKSRKSHHRHHHHRTHQSQQKQKQKQSSKNDNDIPPPTTPASLSYESVPVAVSGPHQTYYINDDISIKSQQQQQKNKINKYNKHNKHSKHHKSSKYNKHRHHHNISRTPINITNIDDIPEFVAANNRRLSLLSDMIEIKRNELERVSLRHDTTLNNIIDLYIFASSSINNLRRQYRILSLYSVQLSREGSIRNKLADQILNTLHNIEEQRKNLLNKIESPSWEIRHHFHILSFEHFRGNQQPHLLEIAEVLPYRLQIAAISHNSINCNNKLLSQFHKSQKERDLLYKKLSQCDKKRNITKSHLKDYKKMMVIIRKNIGEKRLNKLKLKRENEKKLKLKNQNKNQPITNTINTIKQQPIKPQFHPFLNKLHPHSRSPPRDRIREQYLSGIGIRKSKKIEFNLNEFIVVVNNFLGISSKETKQEISDLNDNRDLINPITGQINNPSPNTLSNPSTNGGNNNTSSGVGNGDDNTSSGAGAGTGGAVDIDDNNKDNVKKKKKKSKIKHKLVLKEKALKQNILNVIDKNKFIIREIIEEKKDNNAVNNDNQTNKMQLNPPNIPKKYNIFLKKNEFEEKKDNFSDKNDKKDDDTSDDADADDDYYKNQQNNDNKLYIDLLDNNSKNVHNINKSSTTSSGLSSISSVLSSGSLDVDTPHRDWSVLAKYLKDSSKETARRKQILKQLERILHVREGLIVGFDQLKQIYSKYQNKKIKKK